MNNLNEIGSHHHTEPTVILGLDLHLSDQWGGTVSCDTDGNVWYISYIACVWVFDLTSEEGLLAVWYWW